MSKLVKITGVGKYNHIIAKRFEEHLPPRFLASELGKLGKGKKKTMSQAAIQQRRNAAKCRTQKYVQKKLRKRLNGNASDVI